MKKASLWIIIPCYNEEEVLPVTAPLFLEKLTSLIQKEKISEDSRILFVDDGSKDSTWEIINKLSNENVHFCGIQQSRNRGHQNAVLAGLMEAKEKCDITISIDCDGQDDINAMDSMIEAFYDGCEIVYGVRNDRSSDTFFKRFSAQSYYKFLNALGGNVVYNHADYRLVSARVLQEFAHFEEVNLFLRGMFPLIGYKSDIVYYERNERFAGESKYPLKKMINFAVDGITSFSIKPIRLILNVGIIIFIISIIMILYALINKIIGNTVSGWTFIVCSIWLIAGVQMMSLGVIGEYIGKIYNETKRRPKYIIEYNLEEKDSE